MAVSNSLKSKVMQAAWTLAKSKAITIKEALKQAWQITKALIEGKEFQFAKTDGEIRTAQATGLPTKQSESKHIFTYYDKAANGWRSFDVRRFIFQ